MRSDRRLQQIVYMEKMKLGFDNGWLLPPPLQQNLSSVGCSRAGVGRPSLRVRARVYSLSLLSLSSRSVSEVTKVCSKPAPLAFDRPGSTIQTYHRMHSGTPLLDKVHHVTVVKVLPQMEFSYSEQKLLQQPL